MKEDLVTLPEKVVEEALAIARGREEQNTGVSNARAYDHGGYDRLPFDSLQAQLFAVVGEKAGYFYFDVQDDAVWVVKKEDYKSSGLKKNADLRYVSQDGTEWKIEIRNCVHPASPIPIKEKDNQENLIVVQVHVHPNKRNDRGRPVKHWAVPTGDVEFLGWRYGTDYRPGKAKNGCDSRLMKYAMEDLWEVIR